MATPNQSRSKKPRPLDSERFLFDAESDRDYLEALKLFTEDGSMDGKSLEDVLAGLDRVSFEDAFASEPDDSDRYRDDYRPDDQCFDDPELGETAACLESAELIGRDGNDDSLQEFFGESGFFVTTPQKFEERIDSSRPPESL